MKIIDLLNKIAKGEEVPQKIKIGNKIYNYEKFNIGKGDNYFTAKWREVKGYRISYDGTYYYLEIRDYNLNDEVEILEETVEDRYREMEKVRNYKPNPSYLSPKEEKKIPEKLNISNFPKHNNSLKKTAIKLNEVIDYLNSKGE